MLYVLRLEPLCVDGIKAVHAAALPPSLSASRLPVVRHIEQHTTAAGLHRQSRGGAEAEQRPCLRPKSAASRVCQTGAIGLRGLKWTQEDRGGAWPSSALCQQALKHARPGGGGGGYLGVGGTEAVHGAPVSFCAFCQQDVVLPASQPCPTQPGSESSTGG